MAKLRMSREEQVLCGLALDPGVSLKEAASDEQLSSEEAKPKKGFISDEDLGVEHVLVAFLSESDRRACTDPLEYAISRRDGDRADEEQRYEPKTLTRNLRLV